MSTAMMNQLFGRRTQAGRPVLDGIRNIIKQYGPTLTGILNTAAGAGGTGATSATDLGTLITSILTGLLKPAVPALPAGNGANYMIAEDLQLGPGSVVGTLMKMCAEVVLLLEDANASDGEKVAALTTVLGEVYQTQVKPLLSKVNPFMQQVIDGMVAQALPAMATAIYTAIKGVMEAAAKAGTGTNAGATVAEAGNKTAATPPTQPAASGAVATQGTVTQQ